MGPWLQLRVADDARKTQKKQTLSSALIVFVASIVQIVEKIESKSKRPDLWVHHLLYLQFHSSKVEGERSAIDEVSHL